MKFIKLYIVLFISQLSFQSYAQIEKDSIIITKELISITFTNQNTITDLGNIKKDLSKIGARLSYSMMEMDENNFLKKISARIVYPDQTVEMIYQYELINTNSTGFYKTFTSKKEVKQDTREVLAYYKNDSLKRNEIDFAAVYKGCESIKDEEGRARCTRKKIQKHVVKNFRVKLAQKLGLSRGKKRIFVMFVIDKKGLVKHVDARAPHPKLEKEAIRVVNSLLRMTPAMYKGKPVNIKYSMPITFIVD